MKHYFVQIRYKGKYFNGTISAKTDGEALKLAEKKMKAGELQYQDEDFYDKNRIFITYEEIKNGTTGVNIKETSTGVQMGNTGVISEKSNT
tara:strand:+ start:1100 stop:1372 length:273 start_codon:yes stop_codon:yes gene_type:complete